MYVLVYLNKSYEMIVGDLFIKGMSNMVNLFVASLF